MIILIDRFIIVKFLSSNVSIQISSRRIESLDRSDNSLRKSAFSVHRFVESQLHSKTTNLYNGAREWSDDKFMTQLNDNLLNGIYREM